MANVLDIERGRQDALDRLYIVDTRAEDAYDDIARLAQMLCGTPIALVSLVDRDRQWFKARVGTLLEWIPREISFCDHTIRDSASVMQVHDARVDERFRDNPLVKGEPHARAHAGAPSASGLCSAASRASANLRGAPIVTRDGHAIGAVCVVDYEPRVLDEVQLAGLQALARQVVFLLELRTFLQEERERYALSEDITRRLLDDRSQLERLNHDLMERALRDSLTGLLNRAGMQALRDTPAFMARIEDGAYCLALADVDHFKRINDTYGHTVGDEVLRAVAAIIRGCLREGDYAGRYGGEEFIALFPQTRIAEAARMAELVRERVEAMRLPCQVTLSIGLVEGRRCLESRLIALARADRALYEAKRNGRNQVALGEALIG